MSKIKKVPLATILAILAAAGYGGYTIIKESDVASINSSSAPTYQVTRIIDGDTIELADGDVVRILGIDAPESGECYAEESRKALESIVLGKSVELRKDVTATDAFGRLLRYVVLPESSELKDNVLVDALLVGEGYAKPAQNPHDKLYAPLLLELREQAARAGRGLWGVCEFEISEYSRTATAPANPSCVIKGNISTMQFGKTYFLPNCRNYSQVKIDSTRGEQYFCSESEALAAGFRKGSTCP